MSESKRSGIWAITALAIILVLFGLFAAATIYIDPLFHYHAPLREYSYPLDNERYQNDGIMRNFEYDGIITGTSMAANFMKSQADEVFEADFVKTVYVGGYYKEINDSLQRAYDSGKQIRYVIRTLDTTYLIGDKDNYREDFDCPVYLYNDSMFDDLNYVLNKSIFLEHTCRVIEYTSAGNATTSFDEYSNWNDTREFGAEAVMRSYTLNERAKDAWVINDDIKAMVLGNICQNVTYLAGQHPETTFYLFFPPYSICQWNIMDSNGQVDLLIDAQQIAIEEMLKIPNIRLFAFDTNFEMVCDLENYSDTTHYGEWINSRILEWMGNDEYLLTEDNYRDYIETIREFYNSYDYDSLHE